jgi:hypothetical protein
VLFQCACPSITRKSRIYERTVDRKLEKRISDLVGVSVHIPWFKNKKNASKLEGGQTELCIWVFVTN